VLDPWQRARAPRACRAFTRPAGARTPLRGARVRNHGARGFRQGRHERTRPDAVAEPRNGEGDPAPRGSRRPADPLSASRRGVVGDADADAGERALRPRTPAVQTERVNWYASCRSGLRAAWLPSRPLASLGAVQRPKQASRPCSVLELEMRPM